MDDIARPLTCLQIGGDWFSECPGGMERYYADLLHHLPQARIVPRGLTLGTERVAVESRGAVEAFSERNVSVLARWRGVRRAARAVLRSCDVDLVASHFALYALPVLRVIRPLPHVVHFHGPWAMEAGVSRWSLKAGIERAVYRRGAVCIVLSKAWRDVLQRDYGVPIERIRVVPGGVDLAPFEGLIDRAAARERLGWPSDRRIVLTVRRLVPAKGLAELIAAVVRLRRSFPDVLVLIAGTGTLETELRRKVADAGLGDHVRFLGHVPTDDLPLAYRASDLTIVPSVALEGFGLVAPESLAAGTPVLVTPVGGLPEVVRALSPDLILTGTGAGPVAEGLIAALSGRIRLPSSDACHAYAKSHFDWHVIARQIAEVYREVAR